MTGGHSAKRAAWYSRFCCLAVLLLSLAPHRVMADQIADAFAAYQHGDYLRAYLLCRPFADHGVADAELLMGLMYANGKGVRQSYPQAADWYRSAADDGQDVAQNNLGLMYAAGLGVRQSYEAAAKLYWLAADRGNPRAQYNLAVAYRNGKGVEQDYVRAYMWYTLSTKADWDAEIHQQSSKERDEIAKQMTPDQVTQAQADAANWKPTLLQSALPPPR
jgi:TPR repeat protein